MTATTLLSKFGAAAATGAIAFTAFAGTGLAAGNSGMFSFGNHNCNDIQRFQRMDVNDVCGKVKGYTCADIKRLHAADFDDSCGKKNKSQALKLFGFNNDCRAAGFSPNKVRGFFDAFNNHFGAQSANVNANANTTVNSTINAGSSNNVNVDSSGGLSNVDVDADANTNVNSEINALSENNVNVDQN